MMEHLTPIDHQLGGCDNRDNTTIPEEFDKNNQPSKSSAMATAFDSFDKVSVDLDSSDLFTGDGFMLGTGDDELEKMLAIEAEQEVDDLHLDQLNLDLNDSFGSSESSMDQLLSMNIIEVDDNNNNNERNYNNTKIQSCDRADILQEFATGFLENDESYLQQQQQSEGCDTLLGRMSREQHAHYQQQQQQEQQVMMMNQQIQYEIQQQQNLEQKHGMPVHNGMLNNEQFQEEEVLTAAKVSQLAQMGSDDLEREKMKLLSRLQEIDSRMASVPTMGGGMMMQHKRQPQLGLVSSWMSSGVASVKGISNTGSGETPLSAFLRGKNNGNGAAVRSNASIFSQQRVLNTPAATSILDAAPYSGGSLTNPFLQHAGGRNPPLMTATKKSSSSQNMIRQTHSGRNLRASGVSLSERSGQNLMAMLGSDLGVGGNSHNAAWGSSGIASRHIGKGNRNTSSFSTSGILSRHVSDGQLLSGATTMSASLAKSKHRVGSLSRENSLYNIVKNRQGSHKTLNALGRQGSHTRLGMTKTGSKGSLNESFGNLLPTKRGGGRTSSKYRIGACTSVPHLMMRGESGPGLTHGGNAMW